MKTSPHFWSRRSDARALQGMVATSQPLAAQAGLDVLKKGGNAADAAVTTAAVLSVVEPGSTGVGGDCFALFFDAATSAVSALNGSGRAPAGACSAELRALGYARMPQFTGHAVSIPGTAAGWHDLLDRHGTLSLSDALRPAIAYAEEGYPVSEWIARGWQSQVGKLLRTADWPTPDRDSGPPQPSGRELLLRGRAPRAGEIMTLPTMGATLRGLAADGPGFIYAGDFAARLAAHVQRYGGWITAEDMAQHRSTWEDSLTQAYRGRLLHECPPNGQGLAALIAVGLAEGFELAAMPEADAVHVMIECMRLAFADAQQYVCDPQGRASQAAALLAPAYLERRRRLISLTQAARHVPYGYPLRSADTVYLSAIDGAGNACSFINSLYMGMGSGLVVPGTGISLQNRAALFDLDPEHPNGLAPRKRPYHTIIPALVTDERNLLASFGVMGGFMQPQGHLQMMVHMYDGRRAPQHALDAPRWQLGGPLMGQPNSLGAEAPGGRVLLEEGFAADTVQALIRRGHRVAVQKGFARGGFGGGQIICRDPHTGVLTGGSDPRKDGCALGW